MASRQVQRRNIVLLGKTGAGKSTVANNIAGYNNFVANSSTSSVTSRVSHTETIFNDPTTNAEFHFKLIDTVGVFGTKKRNDEVMKEIKTYFQDKLPEGVNLVVFVFRKGRFTAEERQTFDYIIENFKKEISSISALVITNCENENERGRQDIIEDFRNTASDIAHFMGKGIYAVGFPDTRNMLDVLRTAYEDLIRADANKLRQLAKTCSEMRLSKEMFELTFWEKLKQCVIL